MTQKQSSKPNRIIKLLDIEDIDSSPFQRRKYFNADKLKELADSIRREGLIEPIVVRPHGERYQLIAGERRWRAIRNHTDMEKVQAQVVMADDLRARRMAAAENLQREDLTIFETIEPQ